MRPVGFQPVDEEKKQVVRISHPRETRSICGLDGCAYFRASEQQGAVRTHRSHLAFFFFFLPAGLEVLRHCCAIQIKKKAAAIFSFSK